MANFKIVTNLDLSGNSLIDVTEITRENYDKVLPNLDLVIRAGSNPAGGDNVAGGSLRLYSGAKGDGTLTHGSVELIHPLHDIILSDTSLDITLASVPFNITSGALGGGGTINIDSDLVTVINDLWIKGNTTLGDGIGQDVTILGSNLMVAASIDLGDPSNPENIVFTVENETGNTEILGTFNQVVSSLDPAEVAYQISVGGSAVFTVLGDGGTTIAGALYVESTPVWFKGATDFQIGDDDSATRTALLNIDVIVGSDTNSKTFKVNGDSTFSNIAANTFTTLVSDKATVNLFDSATTTVNAFGDATTIDIGSDSGITTIRNNFQVIGETEYLRFNPTFSEGSLPGDYEGILFYSTNDKALSYRTDVTDTTINLGQETVFRAKNVSGVTIENGALVYISGAEATGNIPQITLARANLAGTSQAAGVATSQILNNDYGYVTVEGIVRGIDTSSFSAGDTLYLSYAIEGAWTNIAPSSVEPANTWDVQIGSVLDDAVSGSIKVHITPGWSTYSSFNQVKIEALKIRDRLTLATAAQTIEGSIYYDDSIEQIKYYTDDTTRTIVDIDTSQDIINKTYNELSLTANTVGFSFEGGSTSKSLTLVGDVLFSKDFTLSVGNLIVNADVLHSEITLPDGHLSFGELDTSDSAQRSLAIQNGQIIVSSGLETDTSGNLFISGYIQVEGDYKTAQATYNILPDIVTTTLNLAQLTPDINIGNLGAVQNAIEIGNSNVASVVSFNSTKNSDVYTSGGVVIDGGVGIALDLHTNGHVHFEGNSQSNPLILGTDVHLYRSDNDELTIADDVILNDLQSANTTFNFATETTTIMNMLALSNTTLNVGVAGANTREFNIFSHVTVGELSNQKDIDLYGSLNIGGPSGYGIQYDSDDDSINFVKLA